MVLEGYFSVGMLLCSLDGFNIFGVRAICSMHTCHLFPQCMLAIIPLIGGVTDAMWLDPALGIEWASSLLFGYHCPIQQRRWWHPTPVLLPGKSHGWRSLEGCSPWGREESDTAERLAFHFSLSCIGEGNGNLLQCSCLEENPRDRGALWAAIYGVAQSRTRLKRLSSSSSSSPIQDRVCSLIIGVEAPSSTFELCLLCTVRLAGLAWSHWERSHWVFFCWACSPMTILCCVTFYPLCGLIK